MLTASDFVSPLVGESGGKWRNCMDNSIWKELYGAVEENNTYGVFECAVSLENEIAERWQSGEREEFERTLRLYIQKTGRMKRDLVDETQMIPYQLGVIAGVVQAFERVCRTEGDQQGIIGSLAQSSGKTRQILNCLYREHGMRHGELAEAVGSTASSLTNLMKRVLQSGAVEASRSGKNTFYMLTPAGERYCAQQQARNDAGLSPEVKRELTELITRAIYKMAMQKGWGALDGSIIREGEKIVPVIDNIIGDDCTVRSVTRLKDKTFVSMTKETVTMVKESMEENADDPIEYGFEQGSGNIDLDSNYEFLVAAAV